MTGRYSRQCSRNRLFHLLFNRPLNLLISSAVLAVLSLNFGRPVHASSPDKLVIISPHRKSIQDEYLPAFRDWYKNKYRKDIDVEWLDQGGSNDDVKFIKARFVTNPKSAGIDIFWGGGTTTHSEIANQKMADILHLNPELKSQIPLTAGGIPLTNKDGTYIAQALSSFGIFYNRRIIKIERLPEPLSWEVLADPRFNGKIVLTDSRKSGTASIMNHVILESLGWRQGFEILTAMAGNARQFTQSSSDVIKSIVSGDAAATLAIDFYALAKIGDLGTANLGFSMPEGKTIIEGDPISVLRGAPNRIVADRFVEFVLSPVGQMLLILRKGTPGGPKFETLGRMAVNLEAYKRSEGKRVNPMNPFEAKGFLKYDPERQARIRFVLDDLIGALLVDNHPELRAAWGRTFKKGCKKEEIEALSTPPATANDLEALASLWNDAVVRNKTINQWTKFAREKYARTCR